MDGRQNQNMTFLKRLVALLSIPALLTAGGTVPDGMGAWDNGARDPIPSSPARMFYKFIGFYSGSEYDYLTLAVASLDYELPNTRLWYGQAAGNVGQIWFSKVDQPATVGCSDSDPTTFCKLAETICEQWSDNAGPKYKLCDAYRIRLYASDIYAYSARTEKDAAKVWHNIVRHELGHVLGLNHTGGVMDNNFDETLPLTSCQHDLLDQYVVDYTTLNWTYLPAPASCN